MAQSRSNIFRITLALFLAFALTLTANALEAPLAAPLTQPSWSELSLEQREVLHPLAGEWDKMESYRRKKWLGIAQRYASMSPDERQRIQRRMQEWVKLSPTERQQARDRYKNLKKTAPEHRETIKQKWQEYKKLPDSEKEKLKQQALTTKASTHSKDVKTNPTTTTGGKTSALPPPGMSPGQVSDSRPALITSPTSAVTTTAIGDTSANLSAMTSPISSSTERK